MARREPSRKRTRRLPPMGWEEVMLPEGFIDRLDRDLCRDGPYRRACNVKRAVSPGGAVSLRFRWIGPGGGVVTLRIREGGR